MNQNFLTQFEIRPFGNWFILICAHDIFNLYTQTKLRTFVKNVVEVYNLDDVSNYSSVETTSSISSNFFAV